MSDEKEKTVTPLDHAHPSGKRCCGRPLSEKCGPEEQAAKIDPLTGKKRCCKGGHHS